MFADISGVLVYWVSDWTGASKGGWESILTEWLVFLTVGRGEAEFEFWAAKRGTVCDVVDHFWSLCTTKPKPVSRCVLLGGEDLRFRESVPHKDAASQHTGSDHKSGMSRSSPAGCLSLWEILHGRTRESNTGNPKGLTALHRPIKETK